jgi:hypothetical protein
MNENIDCSTIRIGTGNVIEHGENLKKLILNLH